MAPCMQALNKINQLGCSKVNILFRHHNVYN